MVMDKYLGVWAVVGVTACLAGSIVILADYGGDALFRAWLLAFSYSCVTRWMFRNA